MAVFLHVASNSCEQDTDASFLAFMIDGCYRDIKIHE